MSELQPSQGRASRQAEGLIAGDWRAALGGTPMAVLCCAIAAVLLYATAPRLGDFWWSEAPRNALNGAFVLDFLRHPPLHDPVGWAYRYYDQYPALTIFFYPPLFPFILSGFYAVFGVSHAVAQATESLFVLALGLGGYMLARRMLQPLSAIGAALALMSAPELALWGRQVMLDVPALAFVVWSLVATVTFIETRRPILLYAIAALVLGAVYTKLNAAYILAVHGILLWRAFGPALLRMRHLWFAAILSALALVPIVAMESRFGATNLTSIQGSSAAADLHPATEFMSWLFYIQTLPAELGWAPTLAGVAGLLALFAVPSWRADRARFFLPLVWLAIGYLVFGLVSLKEQRHAITFLFPVLIFACYLIERVFRRFGPPVAALFGAAVLAATLLAFPTPREEGYQAAADYIAANAPKDGLVMFSGLRDGTFIFDLRAHAERSDLKVWRADKLLLDVSVMRERGIHEIGLDETTILARIREAGVSYIVAQDGFWNDLAVMQRFETVLHGPEFTVVDRIPITGHTNPGENQLTIYRANGPVGPRTADLLNTPSMAKPGGH
jgi:hypothetical protein